MVDNRNFLESIAPGYTDRKRKEESREREQEARQRKKERLNQELEDAEWILKYERKLAKLQAEVEVEVKRTGDHGRSTKRLHNLQSHLRDVRRSITLD